MSSLDTIQHYLRSRLLYRIAKAAWENNINELVNRLPQELASEIEQQFGQQISPSLMANHIRIVMGLDPQTGDKPLSEQEVVAALTMERPSYPAIVANPDACRHCAPGDDPACLKVCTCNAIIHSPEGAVSIDYDNCLFTGHCVENCAFGALADKGQFLPMIHLLQQKQVPVFASIAPAFAGQFGDDVTPGRLRTALLKLGFADMVETALYADLVTIKEAFEFDELVQSDQDFMLTSCCCPVWIKLIQTKFPDLLTRMSPSVSPMVASGRIIKAINPTAKVIFIGPCIAKKAEAMNEDIKDAIDFVLTFKELATVFEAVGINPATCEDQENPQASRSGRIYGRSGGVSEAVECTLRAILPNKAIQLRAAKADSIPACQKLLQELSSQDTDYNFMEGMACPGGCVGGPGRLIEPRAGADHVDQYGDKSNANTPVENSAVYTVLQKLGAPQELKEAHGHNTVDSLLARKFC